MSALQIKKRKKKIVDEATDERIVKPGVSYNLFLFFPRVP